MNHAHIPHSEPVNLAAINKQRALDRKVGMDRPEIYETVNVSHSPDGRVFVSVTLSAGHKTVVGQADPLFYVTAPDKIQAMTRQARNYALDILRGVETA